MDPKYDHNKINRNKTFYNIFCPRLDDVYEKIEEEVGIFTDVEGTGLYELQSKLNHSCQPNVQVGILSTSHYLVWQYFLDHISLQNETQILILTPFDTPIHRIHYLKLKSDR